MRATPPHSVVAPNQRALARTSAENLPQATARPVWQAAGETLS
jgi:hypothetical protein